MKRAEFTWDKIEIRPRANQKPLNSSESTRRVREGLEEQPNGLQSWGVTMALVTARHRPSLYTRQLYIPE